MRQIQGLASRSDDNRLGKDDANQALQRNEEANMLLVVAHFDQGFVLLIIKTVVTKIKQPGINARAFFDLCIDKVNDISQGFAAFWDNRSFQQISCQVIPVSEASLCGEKQ